MSAHSGLLGNITGMYWVDHWVHGLCQVASTYIPGSSRILYCSENLSYLTVCDFNVGADQCIAMTQMIAHVAPTVLQLTHL